MPEPDIQAIVQAVLAQMQLPETHAADAAGSLDSGLPSIDLADPSLPEARKKTGIETPIDAGGLAALMSATPARIGVGRCGPRPPTAAVLLFQADHGVTQDALMHEVDPGLLEALGLFSVESQAVDRQQYLKRPDLGRKLTEASQAVLRDRCVKGPDVQIFVGDGLSGAAIEHNLKHILPVFDQGLKSAGLTMGTLFFVKNARVGLLNEVNRIVDAKVCAILIGERPGLARAESMSIYLGYRPRPESTDANREAICNIYQGGLNPLEAGAHAVARIQKMIKDKTSGIDPNRV